MRIAPTLPPTPPAIAAVLFDVDRVLLGSPWSWGAGGAPGLFVVMELGALVTIDVITSMLILPFVSVALPPPSFVIFDVIRIVVGIDEDDEGVGSLISDVIVVVGSKVDDAAGAKVGCVAAKVGCVAESAATGLTVSTELNEA